MVISTESPFTSLQRTVQKIDESWEITMDSYNQIAAPIATNISDVIFGGKTGANKHSSGFLIV